MQRMHTWTCLYATWHVKWEEIFATVFPERNIALAGIDISTEDSKKRRLLHVYPYHTRFILQKEQTNHIRESWRDNDKDVTILKS